LAFLVAESGDPLVLGGTSPQSLQDARRHSRIEQALASGDSPYGVHKVGRANALQHVAGRAGEDRLEQGLVIGEGGQDQAGRAGME